MADFANDRHYHLKNGVGLCSVPMWCGELPAGLCDRKAFGERPPGQEWRDPYTGESRRFDGKYNGYVPGLACEMHGGPKCPGIEIELGVFSGCDGSGGDCPTCND